LHISKKSRTFAAQRLRRINLCLKTTAMKTNNNPQEMSFGSESGSINNVQKKCYTADEAVAFLEPRIRAMFK
jgi:hypothetical protein